ncbi:ROK family transcriptional regulator [Paenibacillus sp. TRM 82003]|nr:ROK family transcriptional regulator [Paenibacillus sp. TRM 82003]
MKSTEYNSHKRMKSDNRERVLSLLHQEPLLSRIDIAERTRLTKQTVTNIVADLIAQGLVREEAVRESGAAGRPAILLRLQRELLYAIGVEATRTALRGVILDNDGVVRFEASVPLVPSKIDGDDRGRYVVETLRRFVWELVDRLPSEGVLTGVGIGVQGIIDRERGIVKFSRYLKLFEVPLRELLMESLPVPVYVDNNVRAFAVGEIWRRKTVPLRHVLCVYLDDGIGGALLVNGELYTGDDWQAAKVGHIKAVRGGNLCHCGKRGCLEAHISIPALKARLGDPGVDFRRMMTLLALPENESIVQELGELLGFVLGNAMNLLNPEAVIVGGALSQAGALFRRYMMDEIERTVSIPNFRTPIDFSAFHRNNGSSGAAALAFSGWIKDPELFLAREIKQRT